MTEISGTPLNVFFFFCRKFSDLKLAAVTQKLHKLSHSVFRNLKAAIRIISQLLWKRESEHTGECGDGKNFEYQGTVSK